MQKIRYLVSGMRKDGSRVRCRRRDTVRDYKQGSPSCKAGSQAHGRQARRPVAKAGAIYGTVQAVSCVPLAVHVGSIPLIHKVRPQAQAVCPLSLSPMPCLSRVPARLRQQLVQLRSLRNN